MIFDAAELRRRLARPAAAVSIYADDGAEREAAAVIAAAVLVPIIARHEGLTVLFTRRTEQLKSHSGQISFPGGRAEPGDPSPQHTALREAQEEIGLAPARVEVLGQLAQYNTRTGFGVTPVIGLIQPPLEVVPDAREVDEVFEVPLAFLLDPANHRRESRQIGARMATYYVIEHQGRIIWGATAGMLVNLYRRLAA